MGAGIGSELPDGFILGDRIIKFCEQSVFIPTALKTYVIGKISKVDIFLKRVDKELKESLPFSPQPKILTRQYLLSDRALITEDVSPKRLNMGGHYQLQSVRKDSYAARLGWVQW